MGKNRQKVKKKVKHIGEIWLMIREDPVEHLWCSAFAKIVNDF